MSIPIYAGKLGIEIVKQLKFGKSFVGKKSKDLANFAGKKGYAKTSKAITGAANKGNEAIAYGVKTAKKYPKSASAVGGAIAFDIFDDE